MSFEGVSKIFDKLFKCSDGKIHSAIISRAVAYLLLVIALFLTFEIFVYYLHFSKVDYLTMHIRRAADAMMLALPVWFISRKLPLYIWVGILEIYLNANMIYYQYYDALIPFSSFGLVENLSGIGDSILLGAGWCNLALLIFPLLWCVWYGVCRIDASVCDGARKNRTLRVVSACIFLLMGAGINLPSYVVGNKNDYSRPWNLFQYEPIRAFEQFGWINYWIYQTSKQSGVSDEEMALARDEVRRMQNEWAQIQPVANVKGKNLIVILVESLGSWPISLEVEGERVTPRLDEIISWDSTIYFPNVLPQVKHGRSSDAQLLINTGLLPLADGAASSLYAHNNYHGLPKALKQKGYSSSLYLCDDKKYWNQGATSIAYGFDRVCDNIAPEMHVLSDGELFKVSFQEICEQKQPFYSMLVTMSGHDAIRGNLKSKFHKMHFASEEACNITAIVNYTDSCIGAFVDGLKASGLYDNSVIVVTGDHDGVGRNMLDGRDDKTLEDRFIPFIIINAPDGMNVDDDAIIGQSDIYPSLLDLMGVSDYCWRGVGESVFRFRESGAIYRDMSAAGDMMPQTAERRRHAWVLSDILIRMGWFGDF